MKHGESDVEWQTRIQGIHLSDFRNYFWKREGSFNLDFGCIHNIIVIVIVVNVYSAFCSSQTKKIKRLKAHLNKSFK